MWAKPPDEDWTICVRCSSSLLAAKRTVGSVLPVLAAAPTQIRLIVVGYRCGESAAYLREVSAAGWIAPGDLHWMETPSRVEAMRRLFYGTPPVSTTFAIWWDANVFLSSPMLNGGRWLDAVRAVATTADVVGRVQSWEVSAEHVAWLRRQPWYVRKVRKRGAVVKGVSGEWWVARREVVQQHDWPAATLHEEALDCLFGALCWQRGYRMRSFCDGLRVVGEPIFECPGAGVDVSRRGMSYGPCARLLGRSRRGHDT